MINFGLLNEQLPRISQEGYALYQKALKTGYATDYWKAGSQYDTAYTGLWGDILFSGIEYEKLDEAQFLALTGLDFSKLPLENRRESLYQCMAWKRNSLVISCALYLKSLEIDPNHFLANLQLAGALTASLQIAAAEFFWRRSLLLNREDTIRAIIADSMAKFHRGSAMKLITLLLNPNPNVPEIQALLQALCKDQHLSSFRSQVSFGQQIMLLSPYIQLKIGHLLSV